MNDVDGSPLPSTKDGMAATASSPRKQQRKRDLATSAARRTPKPTGSTTAPTSHSARPELPQNLKYRITPKSLYPQQSAVPFCQYSTPQTNQKESGLPTGHHLKYNTLKEYCRLTKPYPPPHRMAHLTRHATTTISHS